MRLMKLFKKKKKFIHEMYRRFVLIFQIMIGSDIDWSDKSYIV